MLHISLFAFVLGTALASGAAAQSAPRAVDTASPVAITDTGAASTAPEAGAPDGRDRYAGDCFRFVFGEWTPPLDAKAAGHAPFPPSDSLPHAPGGRDWAFSDSTAHDVQLMLYPSFWPAGVSVRFPRAPRAVGDTVRGRAIALVADGRVTSPEAETLAWLVPCKR